MWGAIRGHKIAVVAIAAIVTVLLLLAFYSASGPHVLNSTEIAQFRKGTDHVNGKTVVLPCRYGGNFKETASGFGIYCVLPDDGRIMAWLGRETPRPDIKFGDLIYATLKFVSINDVTVLRIEKQ